MQVDVTALFGGFSVRQMTVRLCCRETTINILVVFSLLARFCLLCRIQSWASSATVDWFRVVRPSVVPFLSLSPVVELSGVEQTVFCWFD